MKFQFYKSRMPKLNIF